MVEEAGEDLLHPGVDPLLVVVEFIPGLHVGVARRELLVAGQKPRGSLAGQDPVALDVPAVVEATSVLVDERSWDVMG